MTNTLTYYSQSLNFITVSTTHRLTKKKCLFWLRGLDNIQESDGNNRIDIFVNHPANIFILMQLGLISH
jgi:hypothetical protein